MTSSPQNTEPASRTQHSARNAITGVLCQGASMVLAFMTQWVFIRTLGRDYMGISGWFSSILAVLSISELGIGTAVVASLYQPLVRGDRPRIRATLRLLRRAYGYVGLAVLGLGLCLLPFLHALLGHETDLVDLRLVYLLYLGQSVATYWFWGYKSAVFTADQRQSRVHFLGLITAVCTSAAQTAVLVLWRNYYAYVAILALSAVLKNTLISRSTDKSYPDLRDVAHLKPGENDEEALPKEQRRGIFRNLFGLSLYRVSGTVLNAADAFVLGRFEGFSLLGLYKIYMLVVTTISTVLTMLFQSFTASVGQLNATGDPDRKHFIFRCLNMLCGWLYGFCSVCLFGLLDAFVLLFFGQENVFTDVWIVPMLVLNFFTSGLLENVIMHKDACGLFWQGRFRPVFSAGLKIGLSIWWVTPLGIPGVLLASVVSRLLTTWWFDPWMVHHYALKASVRGYVLQTGWVMALTAACCWIVRILSLRVFPAGSVWGFLGLAVVCLGLPNLVFFLAFRHREEYAYLKRQAAKIVKQIQGKLK